MSVHHEAAVHAGAWPVMYADFGEARKPMTFATSSGVSMRPSGTLLRRALVNSAGLTNRHDRVTPTEAPSKERFPVLKKALAPDSRERRLLGLKTCNIALEPHHSTRSSRAGHQGPREEATTSMAVSTWSGHGRRMQRSEEHTSELQSRVDLVCRLLLEKKKK